MTDPSASWIEDPSLMPWRFSLNEAAGTVTVSAPSAAATPTEPPLTDLPQAATDPADPAPQTPPPSAASSADPPVPDPAAAEVPATASPVPQIPAPQIPAPKNPAPDVPASENPAPDVPASAAPASARPEPQAADAAPAVSAVVPPWRRKTVPPVTSSASHPEWSAAVVPLRPVPAREAADQPTDTDTGGPGAAPAAAPRPPTLPVAVPVPPTPPPPPPPAPVPAAIQLTPAAARPAPDPAAVANAQAPTVPVGFDTYLRAQLAPAPPPRRGVRGLLYSLSGGRVNPGASTRELAERGYLDRIRTPLSGWHTVTVASTKGGVGKTTTAALLGLTLAEHRADRVVAMDANPDAGNLADRLLGHPATATVRQLLDRPDLDQLVSFPDVARFVNTAGRLQLLASDQDAAKSEAFNRDEYRRVLALLVRFFNIVITDSGTGLIHSAMTGALESTRSLIVTGAPTIDAAGHIDKTLDSLVAHGFDELVADAVIVLTCDRRARSVDPAALRAHFERRCRAVVEIPRDPHLIEGGRIDLEALRPRTRAAARELAAHVADAFTWDFPTPPGFTTGTTGLGR
ncbi:hypothetical protein Psed_6754 (plasmid) [Pseudonocardia dioxanivorans CB1190]|uniref:CobQ/CobB/MinD/ParA nucleotide binding domain-containing protein n=1 Tax=Pseudonocardia dioxanivorans (strain ATCC 55486 / DSM 44775 / JCM 13855 / CB1190) TaxID=675635 RepID=F2L6W3_PSEUX|nr:MinD/ParA family protein [Pseudonocardia dioxanivorans]AEA28835.1 hypothetical protein Psed_6754 [Pseudonocardia dioxanivorans CB1190]GJF01474.1 hypothetical protein PSD17_04380 [Pseudonocardia sp. D17]